MDKKQIALTTGGVIAGLILTYLLWKESKSTNQNAVAMDGSSIIGSGGGFLDSLPAITIPDLSNIFGNQQNTAPPVDTSLQDQLNQLQQQLQDALNSATNGTTTQTPPTQAVNTSPDTGDVVTTPTNYTRPPVTDINFPSIPVTTQPANPTAPIVTANPPGSYSTSPTSGPVVTGTVSPTPITIITGTPAPLHPIAQGSTQTAVVNIPTSSVGFHITGIPTRN